MRLRLDGTGLFGGVGAAVFAVGLLAFLLVLQQPSWTQWHGIKVHGVTVAQQTTYIYGGQHYSIDNPRAPLDHQRRPTTVWLSSGNPSDSTHAFIDNPAQRWFDIVFVGLFIVAGLTIIGYGVVRRQRRW
jgi:hypothetical protein